MTGKKQQLEPEGSEGPDEDFHVTKLKSPRDATSGQAKS